MHEWHEEGWFSSCGFSLLIIHDDTKKTHPMANYQNNVEVTSHNITTEVNTS